MRFLPFNNWGIDMCSIYGVIATAMFSQMTRKRLESKMQAMWILSHARGRDGRGFSGFHNGQEDQLRDGIRQVSRVTQATMHTAIMPYVPQDASGLTVIGNLRAEPTMEYVDNKLESDQQPYHLGQWRVVHNGTIANDKELRQLRRSLATNIDSAAIVEVLNSLSRNSEGGTMPPQQTFASAMDMLTGSYAILAQHESMPDRIFYACNYRPIWYGKCDDGLFIASDRDMLPPACLEPRMVRPYTYGYLHEEGFVELRDNKPRNGQRCLVVCSGGLDSVVTAAHMVNKYGASNVELIHFKYGSRAEGPEVVAVQAVAERLGVPVTIKPLPVYSPSDSNLLNPDAEIAGGEQGAEFAHEWVPARNLLLIAVAVAYAEAKGFNVLALGNNLEEAGAYPDNEPEFIRRVEDLLPFAVGVGANLRIEQPVGNMMKPEIVARGAELDAPLDVTWSCYRAGERHCGKCGPCEMRKLAFSINKIVDPMEYEE